MLLWRHRCDQPDKLLRLLNLRQSPLHHVAEGARPIVDCATRGLGNATSC